MPKNSTDKTEQMRKIRDELMELTDSPLYAERVLNEAFPVIGTGNHDADVVFVGEAPGKNEAKTGKPFCGASGRILDELLSHIKINREKVYITNVVKDRPTNNRDPSPEEIKIYGPFLDRQIEIIQPKVIATLGRFAMEYIMTKFGLEDQIEIISKTHGKVFDAKTADGTALKIVPLYHPAAGIYNRAILPDLKKDFEVLKELVD